MDSGSGAGMTERGWGGRMSGWGRAGRQETWAHGGMETLRNSGLGPRNPAHSALETLRLGSRLSGSATGRAEYPVPRNGKAVLREPVQGRE